jgi:hypothetical protein
LGLSKVNHHLAIFGGTMQPDLLSAHQEDPPADSRSTEDVTPSESFAISEVAKPAPTPVDEATNSQTVPSAQKKRSNLNFAVVGLTLLVFVLFVAFGWVGYWTYTLYTELTSTQQQLAALQAKHDKLQADYTALTGEKEELKADLLQSRTDLEKANSELTSAQADLSTSKQNGEKLQTKLEKAGDFIEILYVTATSDEQSDILKIDRLITESNNQELIQQWDTLTEAPSEDAFSAFLDYLILAARDSLK